MPPRLQLLRLHPRPLSLRTSQIRPYAHSSYGGGDGDPKGSNPQEQGANPSAHLEHPGAPPPKVGQGTGGGPTKKGAEGHNNGESPADTKTAGDAVAQKGGAGSGSSGSGSGIQGGNAGGSGAEGKTGAQPKIHDAAQPGELTEEAKAHNEEVARRRGGEADAEKDKVGKGYWRGHGGADRDP